VLLLTPRRGSTVTIVRIPYIKQLAQHYFLYSTTDVAIWSTVVPGIGIIAAALATLRPSFRNFLSRSKLIGTSSRSRCGSNAWLASKKANRGGYIRSEGAQIGTGLGLRRDPARGGGVTTTGKTMAIPNLTGMGMVQSKKRKGSGSGKALRWNESERDLKDDCSEEFPVPRPNVD